MASTGETWRLGRRTVLVAVALALVAGLSAVGVHAARSGPAVPDPYLWFADLHVEDGAAVVMRDGIPLVRYPGTAKPQENPVTVAQWGLSHYSQGDIATALWAADWLLEHQHADGSWRYHFDFYDPPAAETMRAPWISGLAQGQALSLLVRAAEVSGDPRYLEAGRRALRPLTIPVGRGGVARSWDGHPYYEEYPTKRPSFVLNGYLFALIGLHDFAHATGDPTARHLWRQGERTAAAMIDQFDLGDHNSAYLLGFRLPDGPPPAGVLGSVYEPIQPALVAAMYDLTGRPVYARYAQAWTPAGTPWWRLTGLLVLAGGIVAALVMLRRRESVGAVEGLQQEPDDGVVLPGERLDLGGDLGVGGRGEREELAVRR